MRVPSRNNPHFLLLRPQVVDGGVVRLAVTVHDPAIEVIRLEQGGELIRLAGGALLGADGLADLLGDLVRGTFWVLNVEDRLVGLDEGRVAAALVPGKTFLVERIVDPVDELLDELTAVLEPDGEAVRAGFRREKFDVGNGVGGGEVQTGFVFLRLEAFWSV